MATLSGRVAIVTGASRGIGKQTALLLAELGAHVVLTARKHDELDQVVKEIVAAGGLATAIAGDASVVNDVDRVVDHASTIDGRLDILVNNAGIGILGPLAEMPIEDFDSQLTINVRSVFLFTRRVIPLFTDLAAGANIVNVASITGLAGFGGASAYSATKWAVVGLSRGLDKELSPSGIKVTAICPAGVDTTWAFNTGIDPDEVAKVERLDPRTVAETIAFAISQPKNTRITEMVVYPMSENGHQ